MTRLRSCEGCARHVFATEQVCPFCLCALEPSPEPAQVFVPSNASRAQRLAMAAAIGGSSLLACAQPGGSEALPVETPQAPTAGNVAVPVYGAPLPGNQPPVPRAGRVAAPVAGRGGVVTPVYGAPIAGAPADEDAGVPEAGAAAAGSGGDAAAGSSGAGAAGRGGAGAAGRGGNIAVPVYGAPLPEYGAPPPPKD